MLPEPSGRGFTSTRRTDASLRDHLHRLPHADGRAGDELVKQFEGIIAEQGGELLKTDKWGRKKLAYEVQKFSEGYYTLFEMNAGPDLIAELERRFRNNDSVIKFLSVRLDEAEPRPRTAPEGPLSSARPSARPRPASRIAP